MTNRQQWTLIAGVVMTAVFGISLAIKLRPELHIVDAGTRAPEFEAVHLGTGAPAKIEDYRGKVLLINIWATWCPPCIEEMPSMERLHRKLAGTDFHILAISVDEADSTVVNEFVKKLGLTFEVLHNRDASIRRIYQTTGVPESFVVDREGVIVKRVIGNTMWDSPGNESLIRTLLDAR